jgi:DNA-binding transcriptional LysR family regulator
VGDPNLRRIRYFLALGDTPHFGQAAARLHITQPALSRQIRQLEEEMHVRLLIRDGASIRLTEAGRRLRADAPAFLAAGDALWRDVRQAADESERVTLAFMCGITPAPFVRSLAGRRPQLTVDFVHTTITDQVGVLHDGRADLAFARTPMDRHGLEVRHLYTEPWFVALPTGHRLADRRSVTLAQLAGETLLQSAHLIPEWRDLPHLPREIPGIADNLEAKLEYVAAGRGIVMLPEQAAENYRRPGLAKVAVDGVAPNEVLLAWRREATSPWIREIAAAATPG